MKIGCISYDCRQGIAWIMKRAYDAGLVTDPLVYKHSHPSRRSEPGWYPADTPTAPSRSRLAHLSVVQDWLRRIDVLMCIETPFDWDLLNEARRLGKPSVLMVMHEWTPVGWPARPDYILAPSRLDFDYFRDEFPGRCIFLPVPVVLGTWQQRTIARRFLHNAGNVGHREHKGTRQFVEAIPLVKSDARFVLRAQDGQAVRSILAGNERAVADPRLRIVYDEEEGTPWERLWDDADVYVAPEKFNGLSLPLAEAYAAGMPVITTDRYPANTWLPKEPLIRPAKTELASISRNYRPFDECVVEPAAIAKKIDEWFDRDITRESAAARDWAEQNSWPALLPRYQEFFATVAAGGTFA